MVFLLSLAMLCANAATAAAQSQAALTTFQQHLKESGFSIRSAGTINYEVVIGDVIKTDSGEYYAYYDPELLVMKVAALMRPILT